MNIHEHQAKEILKEFGVPVLNGVVIFDTKEIKSKILKLKSTNLMLKAQIHAGGRGKAGGIKLIKNLKELEKEAENWIAYIYACGFEGSGNFGEWCGKYGLDEFMESVENTIFEGSMEELWDEPEGVSARDNGLFNSLSKYIHEKYLEDNEGVILVQDWVLDEVGPKGFFEENFNWDCGLVPHASSTWTLRANYKSEV